MIRLIFLFFWLFSPPLFARSALHQMRYTALPDRVQITLETDSLPVFSHFGIDNPPRVVIDLQQTRSYTNDLNVGQGEVQGVRSGPKGDEDLRLVIDLRSPAPVNVYPRNGKITIDIFNNLGSRPAPSPPAATPVAVTLEGNLAGLGAFIRQEPPPPGGRLSFSGELYDAQLLQEALRGVEPNWEAWLQQQFGATPGRLLYDGGQKIKAGADFLAQQLFVGRDEYAPLVQRLQRLQQRLDALARELDDVAGV